MLGAVTYSEGSPCPALVLDARQLPSAKDALVQALGGVWRRLEHLGAARILKIALIAPSPDPAAELDYRFVQVLPGRPPEFDLRGTCGHALLGALLTARRWGWLAGGRIAVNLPDTAGRFVCEPEEAGRWSASYTVAFAPGPLPALRQMLLTPEPVTRLAYGRGTVEVSLVAAGNPYVFVDARGLRSARHGLLTGRDDVLGRLREELEAVRAAAATRLGWSEQGAFPKAAVVHASARGRLTVRALSVPSWHPTMALTGLVCLMAASLIEGTVPYRLARRSGCLPGELVVDTAGGPLRAAALVVAGTDRLAWVRVPGKRVQHWGEIPLGPSPLSAAGARHARL